MHAPESPPTDPREIAVASFERGYNCAEAMLLALAPATMTAVQRAGAAFGGGIARRGLVCGCLTGCAAAVGLRLGRTSPEDTDSKELAYRIVGNVLRRFEEEFGTLECRRLTGLDFNEENPQEELDRVHREVCVPLVRFVADAALAELGAAGREDH